MRPVGGIGPDDGRAGWMLGALDRHPTRPHDMHFAIPTVERTEIDTLPTVAGGAARRGMAARSGSGWA